MDDQPNLPVLMFIAHRHVEQRVLEHLNSRGHAITPSQARLLERVSAEGSRATELAEQAQVTKQTAGFLLEQLERQGYVRRVPDPRDGRARLVRLSARGRRLAAEAATVVEAVEREWTEHLGEPAMRALRESLLALRPLTDPYAS